MKRVDFTTGLSENGALPPLHIDGERVGIVQVLEALAEAVNELIDRENRRWEQEPNATLAPNTTEGEEK